MEHLLGMSNSERDIVYMCLLYTVYVVALVKTLITSESKLNKANAAIWLFPVTLWFFPFISERI